MLLTNLLGNYLPEDTVCPLRYLTNALTRVTKDPEYEHRLQVLPEYRESLYRRYPPVCDSCLPNVEEELSKKNLKARTTALGGWLKETKGKERQRQVIGPRKDRKKLPRQLLAWRVRGCLWSLTLTLALVINIAGALDHLPITLLSRWSSWFPPFILLSLLWTFWDPTYATLRSAQIQGRDIRIKGKRQYLVRIVSFLTPFPAYQEQFLQGVAWSNRLLTSYWLVSFPSTSMYYCVSIFLEIAVSSVDQHLVFFHDGVEGYGRVILDLTSSASSSYTAPGLLRAHSPPPKILWRARTTGVVHIYNQTSRVWAAIFERCCPNCPGTEGQ
jgi:hypothetical protein